MNFSTGLASRSPSRSTLGLEFHSNLLHASRTRYHEMFQSSSDLLAYIRSNSLDTQAKSQILSASLALLHDSSSELKQEIHNIAKSFKELNDSTSNLSLNSYTELLNWALNCSEDFAETKLHVIHFLWEKTLSLASQQAFEPSQLIQFAYIFARLGMASSQLLNRISEIDMNKLSLSQLSQVIYICNKIHGNRGDRLHSIASRILMNIPEESYQFSEIAQLIECYSYKDRSFFDNSTSRLLHKLTKYLRDNIDQMQPQDIYPILKFYKNLPKFHNALLLAALDRVISESLPVDNSTFLDIINYLGSPKYRNLRVNNQSASVFKERVKKIIEKEEMSISDYVEYMNNPFIQFNVKDLQTHLELQFRRLPKGPWIITILKAMEKMNMTDFHEVLSGSMDPLITGIDSLSPKDKLLAMNGVSLIFSYAQQKDFLKNAINESIKRDIVDPNKVTQYVNALMYLETEYLIDPAVLQNRQVKQHFLNELQTYPPSRLTSNQAIYLHRIDQNQCINIIKPYLASLSIESQLDFLDTIPFVDITHAVTVLKALPHADISMILESCKFLAMNSNRSIANEFLARLNELPGNIVVHPSFKENYIFVTEFCYKIGGVSVLSKLFNKLDEYMYTNMHIFKDRRYLGMASDMARLMKIKPNTARKLVDYIMEEEKFEPSYMYIYISHRADEGSLDSMRDKIREKFLTKVFDIGNNFTFYKIESILDCIRPWPFKEQQEDEIEEKFVNKIENITVSDAGNLLELLLNIKTPIYDTHNKLIKSLLKAITDSMSKYMFVFETEERFQMFSALTRHNSAKLVEFYGKLISDFNENLSKYTPAQIHKVMENLGRRGIRHDDFIIKICEYVRRSPSYYNIYAPYIFNTLAELNLQEQDWARETVERLLDSMKSANYGYSSDFLYTNYIWALIRFGYPHEEIERLVIRCNNSRQTSGFNFKKYLLYHHFRLNPINVPFGNTEQNRRISKSISMKSKFNYHSVIYHLLKQKLDSLGIDSIKGYSVKELYIPLYLPKLNKSIWIIDPSQTIFNNSNYLRGEFEHYREQLGDFKIDLVVDNFKNVTSFNPDDWEKWLVSNKILK